MTVESFITMKNRQYVLVALLAIAFAGMLAFLSLRNDLPPEQMKEGVLFGVLLVVIAVVSIRRGRPLGVPEAATQGWPKHLLGSFGLAFGAWMLGSTLLLPVVGYAGFLLLEKPWFFAAWCLFALALLPLTRRFMR